ncbi:LIM domain-binding protein 3-like isoform X2 [Daphnia pulex]|uniref:LIM domain-binding protein 3-like isoform X2 n=1 Tax=Daphnia pulex TaxID=6669 RepID=UPI001EDF7922|nr:LIM domain-binding protein 3-like isoform X2 [Daphnia pulex]
MMTVMSAGELTVNLQRDGCGEPFGFRLRGGTDIREAFIIQRVAVGSELRRGDVLTKINDRPCSTMTHREAAELIKNAGTTMTVTVQRGGLPLRPVAVPVVAPSAAAPAPSTVASSGSMCQKAPTQAGASNRTISEIMLSPVENLPVTIFPSSAINEFNQQVEEMDRNRERIVVTHQPYRTLPLVVPGAKTGRDTASSTQSYLALQTQQNAMLWNTPGAPPQSAMNPSSTDAVLKQKLEAAAALVQRKMAAVNEPAGQTAVVHEAGDAPPPKQELVHKQFNSPLGLYSNENVQEVLAQQTGIIPAQPGRKLDMKNSETLRALMEENEKNNKAAAQRDSRGLKEVRPAAPVKTVASNPHFKVNSMGLEKEKIQQSYSFKRLMADVLGETDF